MPLNPKTVRSQLALLRPLLNTRSLSTARMGQHAIGELMQAVRKDQVIVKNHSFESFDGAWILPKDERRQGVILYLHGGGYTCGDLEYAMGFGSALAVECGSRVFCAAYRLAPEAPFPTAIYDVLEAYQYLIRKGYRQITLCGESAGGALCYALCLKLRELALPMPCGIIALSPWVDLTLSGKSIQLNRDRDVSLTKKILSFFVSCYTDNPKNPLASPLLADLTGMPPSLIFAGADEILLDDSARLHEKLLASGCQSRLTVTPERWHAYLLYDFDEDQKDYVLINHFLDKYMGRQQKLRWMRLDNAAKIYPAARSQDWTNVFRLSATLTETVDTKILQDALDITLRRFPSIAVRLRKGVFWYYLQQVSSVPDISPEYSYPLTYMSRKQLRKCAFRVIVYQNRIAVELFHSITDGNGAMVFLKSLVAEYLQQRYGIQIPAENGILGRLEEPSSEEMEDSFPKYAGPVTASRKGSAAMHLSGTPEQGGRLHVTCMTLPVKDVIEQAHKHNVSVTCYLTAAMMLALQNLQKELVSNPRRRKPLKIVVPINLRSIFPSMSLRNFALYTIPEIDPRFGDYTLEEICKVVHHRMGTDITAKQLASMIATNVNSETSFFVRIMPLFIKNIVMKAVFKSVGERTSCLTVSNLGQVKLPEIMQQYVQRMDFILGVQATAPNNCGVLSYKDTLYINFIRDVRESDLEYHFFRVLQDQGLQVQVESN